jgi:hypothetical protein
MPTIKEGSTKAANDAKVARKFHSSIHQPPSQKKKKKERKKERKEGKRRP